MYGNFEVDYELSDYGKLRFEYDDKVSQLDMTPQKRKRLYKSFGFYYILAVIIILIIWFIASLISNAIKFGFWKSLGMHISGGFALFVMSLIILLSAFGGWGKFARLVNGGNLKNVKKFKEEEKINDDMNMSRSNAVRIYDEWLVITNQGWSNTYYLDKVAQVKLKQFGAYGKYFTLSFVSFDGEIAFAKVIIPSEKMYMINLRRIFGDKLCVEKIESMPSVEKASHPVKTAIKKRNKSIGELIGLTCFVGIFILAGILVIWMHYNVEPSIPAFLGGFFIAVSCIALCGIYDFVPILKDVLVPILFGAVFMFFPISLIKVIYKSNDTALTIKSLLGVFTPISAAVVFFGWMGLLFVIVGIKTAIDYIRYREKKDK